MPTTGSPVRVSIVRASLSAARRHPGTGARLLVTTRDHEEFGVPEHPKLFVITARPGPRTPVARGPMALDRRPLAAEGLHRAEGVAQLGQPGLAVLADQLDAPGQRLRAGPGHAGVHQGVEHLPLGLA